MCKLGGRIDTGVRELNNGNIVVTETAKLF